MDGTLLVCRLVLATVFAIAGVAKLMDLAATRAALSDFGLPRRLIPATSILLPALELTVAVALVPVGSAPLAAVAAAALLSAFSVAVAGVLARGAEADCQCFGRLTAKPVGPWTLARNLALLGVALFIAIAGWGGAGTSATGWITDLTAGEAAAITISAVLAVIVAVNAAFSYQLFKQNGRLWREVGELRSQLGAPSSAPRLGARVPPFELPDLDGNPASLPRLLAEGEGALLVFSDPACAACDPLLPELGRRQRQGSEPRVLVVSRGSADDNRVKAAEHGLEVVLLQEDFELAKTLGINGMPAAIRLDAGCRVAGAPALGAEAVSDLLDELFSSPDPLVLTVEAS